MSYEVLVLPSAHEDFQRLYALDKELVRVALRITAELEDDPWLGSDLRARLNLEELRDCRRVAFDRDDWKDKPRYRLVYRNEPSDGAPHIVAILAAAERSNLGAYRTAHKRLLERLRELGEQTDEDND